MVLKWRHRVKLRPLTGPNILYLPNTAIVSSGARANRTQGQPRPGGSNGNSRSSHSNIRQASRMQVLSTADHFTESHNRWPLAHRDWKEVFNVGESEFFLTDDPPLWTPLLTASVSSQVFKTHSGECLNCDETAYGVRHDVRTYSWSSQAF